MSADPNTGAPPPETPGPSVTPQGYPESSTEREEAADAQRPAGEDLLRRGEDDDPVVVEEEAAAAAEAARIGGPEQPESGAEGDPAMVPVYQAGGGEAEGFEAAERDLIETASHGDGMGDPIRDAPRPEVESDRAGGSVYGEPDEQDSTQQLRDPDSGFDDDPDVAPDMSHDR